MENNPVTLHPPAVKKSPNEVTWIQIQQLRLRAEGMSHEQILNLFREGKIGDHPPMHVSKRSYYYYWREACKRMLKELEEDRQGTLASVIQQKAAMLAQAKAQFHKKDDPHILAVANQVHNDAVRQLQEFGFLPKNAEKVELSGELSVKQEIKEFLASVMKPVGEPEKWRKREGTT